MLNKWGKLVHETIINILTKFLIFLSMGITAVVFLNVLSRYIFKSSLPWSEELARFMFIWLTFVGAVIANANFEHMRLDFVVERFPIKVGKVIEGISYIAVITLLIILVLGSLKYTQSQWDWKSSALGVRHGVVYMIAPISFAIMGFQFVGRLIQVIISFKKEV